jgi:hypothetical protein
MREAQACGKEGFYSWKGIIGGTIRHKICQW